MLAPEFLRLAGLVDEHSDASRLSRTKDLCELCVQATGITGTSLSIAGSKSAHITSTVCGTDALSMRLEELQLGLGEGPITDVLDTDRPVLVPDLSAASDMRSRWLGFATAAEEAGAAALFVFPLRVGRTRLGALSLYRARAGDLTAQQLADVQLLAWAATSLLVLGQADPPEDPGAWAVGEGSGFHPEIYQAVGAITVQLDVDGEQAMARLRAHAYVLGQPISKAADDVMAGHHLEPDVA